MRLFAHRGVRGISDEFSALKRDRVVTGCPPSERLRKRRISEGGVAAYHPIFLAQPEFQRPRESDHRRRDAALMLERADAARRRGGRNAALSIGSASSRSPSRQIELVRTFADQAVIAMENTRLLDEAQEALEQQTGDAEVLGVINANPGDLQPVFDAMLEKAMALCDVAFGDLELYEGEIFRAVATRGLTDAFAEQVRRGYPARDNPATRPLIAGERVSHIINMADVDFSKVFTHEPATDEGASHAVVRAAAARGRLARHDRLRAQRGAGIFRQTRLPCWRTSPRRR